MTISRESEIQFPQIIVDDLVRYASEVPLTAGTFAPFPMIDDDEADRAPFDHEHMYQQSLSTYAFRGIGLSGKHGNLSAYTFMSGVLIGQAREQINKHIELERKRNEALHLAAIRLLDSGVHLTDEMVERIDRLADGKTDAVDKAVLVSSFPGEFPALETMNCRRFYDETSMRKAESEADAHTDRLLEQGFTARPLSTRESKDVSVGYGLKTRSKKVRTHITSPDGRTLIESRWTVEAVVPLETEDAYTLPILKSQYLYDEQQAVAAKLQVK